MQSPTAPSNGLEISQNAPPFLRDLRRLSKQCRKLDSDLTAVFREMQEGFAKMQRGEPPRNYMNDAAMGVAIPNFDSLMWKKRCASSDLGRGKRGGLRLIYHLDRQKGLATPLRLYLKSELADVPRRDIERAAQEAGIVIK